MRDSHVPSVPLATATTRAHSPELLQGASRSCQEQNPLSKPANLGTKSGRFILAMVVNPWVCPQGQLRSGSVPRGIAGTSRGHGTIPAPLSLLGFFAILDAFALGHTECLPFRIIPRAQHREPPARSTLTNKKYLTDHSAETRLHPCSRSLSPGSAPARREPGTERCDVSGAGIILTALPGSIHHGQINLLESINKILLLSSSSAIMTHS